MPTTTAVPTLYARICDHFASGGVIVIATYTRATIYRAKHATLFEEPTRPEETGVYVRHGRRRDYVFPQYVRFARRSKHAMPTPNDPVVTDPALIREAMADTIEPRTITVAAVPCGAADVFLHPLCASGLPDATIHHLTSEQMRTQQIAYCDACAMPLDDDCPDPSADPDSCPVCHGWGDRCSAWRASHPDRVAEVEAVHRAGAWDPRAFYVAPAVVTAYRCKRHGLQPAKLDPKTHKPKVRAFRTGFVARFLQCGCSIPVSQPAEK